LPISKDISSIQFSIVCTGNGAESELPQIFENNISDCLTEIPQNVILKIQNFGFTNISANALQFRSLSAAISFVANKKLMQLNPDAFDLVQADVDSFAISDSALTEFPDALLLKMPFEDFGSISLSGNNIVSIERLPEFIRNLRWRFGHLLFFSSFQTFHRS
jgi:hypothetical protein